VMCVTLSFPTIFARPRTPITPRRASVAPP
jgi:hypothetical protein